MGNTILTELSGVFDVYVGDSDGREDFVPEGGGRATRSSA